MNVYKKYFDFISVIKYVVLFLVFLIFNNLENQILPYSSAILTTCLLLDNLTVIPCLIYICSFLIMGDVGLLGASGVYLLVLFPISLLYRKYKTKTHYEFVAYTFVGMLGFVFLGSSTTLISLEKRILTTILTTCLCFLSLTSGKAIKEKGLKFKLTFEELFSVSIMTAVLGIGVSNLISPFLWKGISIFLILFCCYIYRTGIGTIISAVLGISLAVYYSDLNYISLFLLYGVLSESLLVISRYVSALSILAIDYLVQVLFNLYDNYTYSHLICILVGIICFCVIPNELIKSFKDKLYAFREKQLVKQTINRNRIVLSGKLFDISTVFAEMANTFTIFKKNNLTEEKTKSIMEKEILDCVCKECENYEKCRKTTKNISYSLQKMIDIGFAKGRLSLIDFPNEISSTCIHPNNILYGLNKLLADYRARLVENNNLEVGRELIASEALGVSEILRGLALESGQLLKFHNKLEKKLCDKLFEAGFLVTELLLYGENDKMNVSLIIAMKEFSIIELQNVVSNTLGMQMMIVDKSFITEDKLYLSLKKTNDYDAVFGIAKATKDGSIKSGDTHSMTKITPDKFLVALSDGMGSGVDAENVSSTSLSLIESFYKAGLNENLILDTVNKLLTINTEDYYTALDICVIDLKTCCADFIKYGAPYGFIVNENGIKIVEGTSLPLGIIDGLKPSIASTALNDGDMIVLLTDGISDAFNNSGAIIDFLRTLPAKNPQTLADEILNQAIQLNEGKAKDDMTALAVRVYKKTA